MKLTNISFLLLGWLVVLLVSPLVTQAASPYAGNQGNTTKPTTAPIPPVTPVSKPNPIQNPVKANVGDAREKK